MPAMAPEGSRCPIASVSSARCTGEPAVRTGFSDTRGDAAPRMTCTTSPPACDEPLVADAGRDLGDRGRARRRQGLHRRGAGGGGRGEGRGRGQADGDGEGSHRRHPFTVGATREKGRGGAVCETDGVIVALALVSLVAVGIAVAAIVVVRRARGPGGARPGGGRRGRERHGGGRAARARRPPGPAVRGPAHRPRGPPRGLEHRRPRALPVPHAGHERARGVQRAPAGAAGGGGARDPREPELRGAAVRRRAAHLPRRRGALRGGRRRARRWCSWPTRARRSPTRSCARSSSPTSPTSCARRSPACAGCSRRSDDPAMDAGTRRDFVARASARDPAAGGADLGHPLPVRARGHPGAPRHDAAATCRRPRSSAAAELRGHGGRARGRARGGRCPGPAWTPLTERMARTVVRNLVENARQVRRARRPRGGVGAPRGRRGGAEGDRRRRGHPRAPPATTCSSASIAPTPRARSGSAAPGWACRSSSTSSERFGGRADGASREGFGTTITVSLPGAPPPPEDDHEDPSRLGRPSGDRASSPG